MLGTVNLGEFFGMIRDIITYSPIYELLYWNFTVILVFAVLKRSNTKGE